MVNAALRGECGLCPYAVCIISFTGGNVMAEIHDCLLGKMNREGSRKLTGIGCGSCAVTVKCAKKYPSAQITGIDYWGKVWNYARE